MVDIVNPGFETGTPQGWTLDPSMVVSTEKKFAGAYAVTCLPDSGIKRLLSQPYPCYPGISITARCQYRQGQASSGNNPGAVLIQYRDNSNAVISEHIGNVIVSGNNGAWHQSTVITPPAPAGTQSVVIGGWTNRTDTRNSYFDQFSWDYDFNRTVVLSNPPNNAVYTQGTYVPHNITVGGSGAAVTSVTYFDGATPIGTYTTSPFGTNKNDYAVGTHNISAQVTFNNGVVITTDTHIIEITAVPPVPPDKREYKASNAYTFLLGSGIQGISNNVPSTAIVTGVEAVVDYKLDAMVRCKDFATVVEESNPDVLFDIVESGELVMILVDGEEGNYTRIGTEQRAEVVVDRADFTQTETGISEGKKWVFSTGPSDSVTIGTEDTVMGGEPIAIADFLNSKIGLRFLPKLAGKPSYADSGDGAIRFMLDKVRIRVYFDAGSVEYFFASPDKSQVIKGELVHSFVFDGNLQTSDASGVLELLPTLEVVDGNQTWIGDDWTIHSAYPVTDSNQIGEVEQRAQQDGIGMSYNGLPTQQAVLNNRSRYEMITTNFYGDPELDSIYGVHGLPRAFAYNGRFFHRIYTQTDETLDRPRHVAHHHEHLALGFDQGRVDISVVGEPYNFDGAEGASSWAIGDPVVGLLPLSGTILGVFCKKSVWGISGTTVDNFSTQVLVPNNGAIEYTVADMGFPVFANAYGVYTLAQATEYGDYLGTPMSQDVSPWLRPRLTRKYTSDKEVVAAWPVRAKNQYRLVFSDGYVMSMTLNNGQQGAPTFSLQRYDNTQQVDNEFVTQPLVPAAISSQLDDTGEERIHIAPVINVKKEEYE